MQPIESLLRDLDRPFAGDDLFDAISDTVYFLKDRSGRYAAVNQALAERTGRKRKDELIGLMADQAFSGPLGRRIAEQDRAILAGGRPLRGELELHLYPDGREGWCLTWKEPLFGRKGEVVGLVGLSRDIQHANVAPEEAKTLSAAMTYAQDHLDAPLRVTDLAARAKLSPFQFDQRIRLMFGHSAGQYLTRLRIDRACGRLRRSDAPISQIALDCGYADQTAFTRQFRKVVGLSPLRYRKLGVSARSVRKSGGQPATL
jgi:PAS domain S-box-containing protein